MELTLEQKIAIYEQQEEKLQFTSFNNNDAWNVGSAIVMKAMENNLAIAVDITVNGYQMLRYGCVGTNLHNDKWMRRKINTVNVVQMSSIHAAAILKRDEMDIKEDWFLDPMQHACCGGGFPIILKGTGVIGTICVSGLPDYEDHQTIVDVLEDYLAD